MKYLMIAFIAFLSGCDIISPNKSIIYNKGVDNSTMLSVEVEFKNKNMNNIFKIEKKQKIDLFLGTIQENPDEIDRFYYDSVTIKFSDGKVISFSCNKDDYSKTCDSPNNPLNGKNYLFSNEISKSGKTNKYYYFVLNDSIYKEAK